MSWAKWDSNIMSMALEEIQLADVDLIYLAQIRTQWHVLVNTTLKFMDRKTNTSNFLINKY
jgi:hypothetical protein